MIKLESMDRPNGVVAFAVEAQREEELKILDLLAEAIRGLNDGSYRAVTGFVSSNRFVFHVRGMPISNANPTGALQEDSSEEEFPST